MRLSMEEVKSIKTMIYSYVGPNEVKNLCDTIEALQQENEQLFDEDYPGFCDNHKINFCPMCGRKLS